ncbi:hypothetical protein [Acidianus sp. HS-5]|uniref:hypothetical protein n=1 Tax=Acidianus sp. HS-5 TaxID=2886040 RepID=UPI001F2A2C26|nr:hypothetical protein [Acidianus sp. HS-5]
MKVGILEDLKGNTTALWNAEHLIVLNGKREEINLAYGKISNFIDLDILIGNKFLDGEKNFLGQIYDIIIDDSHIIEKIEDKKFKAEMTLGNVAISSAKIFDDFVTFFFPFPIRDCSIKSSVVYEILDYDIMREIYRITKLGGRTRVIIRDKLHDGLAIDNIMKFIIKFYVEKISWKDGFWMIDLIKKKR